MFFGPDPYFCPSYCHSSFGEPQFSSCFRCQREYHCLRGRLYEYLCPWYDLCAAHPWHERFYHSPGICKNRNALCTDRSRIQYYPGSDFYFRISYGRGRRRSSHYYFSGLIPASGLSLFFLEKGTYLKIKKKNLRLDPTIVFPCLALGLSFFIMQASESVISICFNSSLLKYGGDIAVGAMTILTSVMQFAMLPLQGLGQGAQPIISYNYRLRQCRQSKRRFSAAAEIQSLLFLPFMAMHHAVPPAVCSHVYL